MRGLPPVGIVSAVLIAVFLLAKCGDNPPVLLPEPEVVGDGPAEILGCVRRGRTPQQNWQVALFGPGEDESAVLAVTVTDAEGEFRFKDVPPGSLSVVVDNRRPWKPLTETRPVQVRKGIVHRADFTFPAFRLVSGRLPPGMENVLVSVHANGESVGDALTGEDGAFSMEAGLGRAVLLILLYPHGCANITRLLPAGSDDLDLGAFVPRTAPGRIRGTISRDRFGGVEPGVDIRLSVLADVGGVEVLFGRGKTDANGDYEIGNLPDGVYRIKSRRRSYSSEPLPLKAGRVIPDPSLAFAGVDLRGVTIEGGGSVAANYLMPRMAGLTVELLDAAGEPLTDASVRLTRKDHEDIPLLQNGGGDPFVPTNQFWTVDPIAPGGWTIRVERDGKAAVTRQVVLESGVRSRVTLKL